MIADSNSKCLQREKFYFHASKVTERRNDLHIELLNNCTFKITNKSWDPYNITLSWSWTNDSPSQLAGIAQRSDGGAKDCWQDYLILVSRDRTAGKITLFGHHVTNILARLPSI